MVDRNKAISFANSGKFPKAFVIRPLDGIFRSSEQCVYPGDRLSIAIKGSSTTLEIPLNGNIAEELVQFSGVDSALAVSFQPQNRHRTLKYSDHIVINTAFEAGGSEFGRKRIYTQDESAGVKLEVTDASSDYNFKQGSFRILKPKIFNGKTKECLSWGDEIVLKLNNVVCEKGCPQYFGCRVAVFKESADGTTLHFDHPDVADSNVHLYVVPPGTMSKGGCIRAGEQLQLKVCGSSGCRFSNIYNGYFGFITSVASPEYLLSFQTI
eukprot:Awhi_evm1s931